MADTFEGVPRDLPGGGKEVVEFSLRLWSSGPQAKRPLRVDITTPLREANAAGLPEGNENGDLLSLHERLEVLMRRKVGAEYALRTTGQRRQTNSFYVAPRIGLLRKRDPREVLEPAVAAFGAKLGREFTFAYVEDPEWTALMTVYSAHDPEQWAMDRQWLMRMAKKRDAIHARRVVAHRAYFPTREAARGYLKDVRKLRFKGEGGPKPADADDPGAFVMVVARTEPTIATWHLHPVVLDVKGAALRHGGVYEGWETEVIPSLEPPPLSTVGRPRMG